MHSLLPFQIFRNRCCFPPKLSIGLCEMLGSFDAQRSVREETAAGDPSGVSDPQPPTPYVHLRDLLVECAEAVSRSEWQRATRLIAVLSEKASSQGDSTERVVAHFTDGLAMRVASIIEDSQASQLIGFRQQHPSMGEMQSAYLALNQITPFIRFTHLTANQAILEALEGSDFVHIVDFEIMQGVQWPPLMQALAERPGGPPCLRITGTGSDMDILEQTGNRLIKFAVSLGLPFEFNALHANSIEEVSTYMLDTRQGESLAVNCVLQLHRLLESDGETLSTFLNMIHSLEPKVVTLAEREASHNQPFFMGRFTEALGHYATLFDSLEATLPPTSPERVNVERVWFRREIMNIVALEGSERTERHEKFHRWKELFKAAGFNSIPPSTFALQQARLLLRLHYPSEGYQLREEDDCLLLGWQETPLFSVSSWN